jgi:hypothetical protein
MGRPRSTSQPTSSNSVIAESKLGKASNEGENELYESLDERLVRAEVVSDVRNQ